MPSGLFIRSKDGALITHEGHRDSASTCCCDPPPDPVTYWCIPGVVQQWDDCCKAQVPEGDVTPCGPEEVHQRLNCGETMYVPYWASCEMTNWCRLTTAEPDVSVISSVVECDDPPQKIATQRHDEIYTPARCSIREGNELTGYTDWPFLEINCWTFRGIDSRFMTVFRPYYYDEGMLEDLYDDEANWKFKVYGVAYSWNMAYQTCVDKIGEPDDDPCPADPPEYDYAIPATVEAILTLVGVDGKIPGDTLTGLDTLYSGEVENLHPGSAIIANYSGTYIDPPIPGNNKKPDEVDYVEGSSGLNFSLALPEFAIVAECDTDIADFIVSELPGGPFIQAVPGGGTMVSIGQRHAISDVVVREVCIPLKVCSMCNAQVITVESYPEPGFEDYERYSCVDEHTNYYLFNESEGGGNVTCEWRNLKSFECEEETWTHACSLRISERGTTPETYSCEITLEYTTVGGKIYRATWASDGSATFPYLTESERDALCSGDVLALTDATITKDTEPVVSQNGTMLLQRVFFWGGYNQWP